MDLLNWRNEIGSPGLCRKGPSLRYFEWRQCPAIAMAHPGHRLTTTFSSEKIAVDTWHRSGKQT
jgi:hypothetical protein